ncbi:MAG: DUF4118 domain-containing protein [Planctomycetota bacterium]|nr:DUF4118 domain-containing protein [Planctomycetota bacterium]
MNLPISAAQRPAYLRYGIAIIATLLATLVRIWLDPVLKSQAPYTTYFAAVMFTAWYTGRGPTVLVIVAGGLLGNYLFDEPRGSLAISDLEHQVSCGLFLVVGVFAAVLTETLLRTQQRLLEQQQQASADKLASVGRLAASVAHEIRNPLTAMKMWLFSLRESVAGQPELNRKLMIVDEELTRLEGIVREFLEFSRPPAVNGRPEAVTDILQRTLEFLGPRLEHAQIRVVQDFVPDLPAVFADAEKLKQVLLNLIGNAAEAMRDGGELRLSATSESDSDGLRMVVLRVQDTGPGVPQETQRRLFEPFFTTKKQGTGLGLWAARQIMTQHAGRLVLESSSPRCTVFAVWIPAVEVQSHVQ